MSIEAIITRRDCYCPACKKWISTVRRLFDSINGKHVDDHCNWCLGEVSKPPAIDYKDSLYHPGTPGVSSWAVQKLRMLRDNFDGEAAPEEIKRLEQQFKVPFADLLRIP